MGGPSEASSCSSSKLCSRNSTSNGSKQRPHRSTTHSSNSSSCWSFSTLLKPRSVFSPAALTRQQLLLSLLTLLVLQTAVAVNVVYDETGWTKREWHKYKIDFDLNAGTDPAEEAVKSPEVRKHLSEVKLNSLHGPTKRRPVSKFAGMWARDDGSLVASPSDDAVEQAAEAVMCTTCHSLVSHVWGQLVWSINHAEAVSEATIKELVEDACDTQVPVKVLSKYRIVQVEAPELDMSLFVVRERKGAAAAAADDDGSAVKQLPDSSSSSSSKAHGHEAAAAAAAKGKEAAGGADKKPSSSISSSGGTAAAAADPVKAASQHSVLALLPAEVTHAEVEAVQRACLDLALHHLTGLQKQVWPKAREFYNERTTLAQKVLTKALWYNDDRFWEPDAYEEGDEEGSTPDSSLDMGTIKIKSAQALKPADQLCLDMDIMCAFWAHQGQCEANPTYMVGDRKHIGHCKASCGACNQKTIWKQHPQVKSELKKAAAASGQLLRTSVCSASRACMAGGGSTIGASVAAKESGSLLPGAVLAKTPGFVLGKPFWGRPNIREDPKGGLTTRDRTTDAALQDPADEVLLSEGLGSKLLSIPGMDNYFMYQLEYKRRVYQFAQDKETGKIKEDHVLGIYDPRATAEAAARRDRLAASQNLDAMKAWAEQWRLQQAASKHSSGAVKDKPPHAPPMLELLDYLPDTEAMVASYWPYMRQMYTGGEACMVEGKAVERQVELRAACSPDGTQHMLVREPQFCRYIMVLYHPQLCEVPRLKPVPVVTASNGIKKDGSKDGSGESSSASKSSSSDGTDVGKVKGSSSAEGSAKPAATAAAAAAAAAPSTTAVKKEQLKTREPPPKPQGGQEAAGAGGGAAGGVTAAPAAVAGKPSSKPVVEADSKADSSSETEEEQEEDSEDEEISTSR